MTHPKPHPAVKSSIAKGRQRLRSRNWPRPPRRDPLMRLIAQLIEHAGADSSVIATSSCPWASATFIGVRYEMTVRFDGRDQVRQAENLAALLPDMEFSIPGHLVADACVDSCTTRPSSNHTQEETSAPPDMTETLMQISILTIEDW